MSIVVCLFYSWFTSLRSSSNSLAQGGITCGAIDEPRKSSKAINERVIINFRDKNVLIARFCDKNVVIGRFRDKYLVIARFCDKNVVIACFRDKNVVIG